MYPGKHAAAHPNRPAVIMAGSGETITYGELEARSNRLAHFLRAQGVGRLDHYSIYMENNARYVECCAAGERSGHYYTCVNSFLTVEELAYILNNSQSKVLITSQAKRDVALAALPLCPKVELCLIVDGPGDGDRVLNLDAGDGGLAGDTDRRRVARHGDALFVGHDGTAQGHPAAAAARIRRRSSCRSSASCSSSGSTARP